MKKYVKPTLDIVELRIEERLAGCGLKNNGKNDNTPGNGSCPSRS